MSVGTHNITARRLVKRFLAGFMAGAWRRGSGITLPSKWRSDWGLQHLPQLGQKHADTRARYTCLAGDLVLGMADA